MIAIHAVKAVALSTPSLVIHMFILIGVLALFGFVVYTEIQRVVVPEDDK